MTTKTFIEQKVGIPIVPVAFLSVLETLKGRYRCERKNGDSRGCLKY
jgi:hypothetical protein